MSHVWPDNKPALKSRVIGAATLLIGAKVNFVMTYIFMCLYNFTFSTYLPDTSLYVLPPLILIDSYTPMWVEYSVSHYRRILTTC